MRLGRDEEEREESRQRVGREQKESKKRVRRERKREEESRKREEERGRERKRVGTRKKLGNPQSMSLCILFRALLLYIPPRKFIILFSTNEK